MDYGFDSFKFKKYVYAQFNTLCHSVRRILKGRTAFLVDKRIFSYVEFKYDVGFQLFPVIDCSLGNDEGIIFKVNFPICCL